MEPEGASATTSGDTRSPVLFHRGRRDVLVVSGADTIGWLQGQLSQDVAALEIGGRTWSFVLSPEGKARGWGRLHRVGETEVRIDVDPGAGLAWKARLERFRLRTAADLDLSESVPVLSVFGVERAGFVDSGWPGVVGGDLFEPAAIAGWVAELVRDGATELDDSAHEAMRIRAGVPRWGNEIDDDTIPAALGRRILDVSVSFTKGCYTGQELMERIDSRGGRVPRNLTVLGGAHALRVGDDVSAGDSVAGTVTSAAPYRDGWVGLAFLVRDVQQLGPLRVRGFDVGPLVPERV